LRFSAGSVRLIVSGSLGVSGLAEPIALAVHLEDMEERLRFVARLLDGEGMSAVCREFGISRKTGYKIFDRYRDRGWRRSPTGRAGRCVTPTSCPSRWSG
jgi:hypothetical protein